MESAPIDCHWILDDSFSYSHAFEGTEGAVSDSSLLESGSMGFPQMLPPLATLSRRESR